MNIFYKIKLYIYKAWKILRQNGIRALAQTIQSKLTLTVKHENKASVQDWLIYYQNQEIMRKETLKIKAIESSPKVSILILTYNNLLFTKLCLYSIYSNTTYPNFEVIVVDNASSDETPAWLKTYVLRRKNLRVILNTKNLGFAGGNNQAAHEATGEYLIFLNNDTVVTKGWVEGLLSYIAQDSRVGLVGPVTNSTGNEARISTTYTTPWEMEAFAYDRRKRMAGESFTIRMLAFYCVLARKDQFQALGGLDERFAVGMFEDDDIAVRYYQQGLRVICAEDVFIHHFQSMSFGELNREHYNKIFEENRKKYEEKWKRNWEPYQARSEFISSPAKTDKH